MSRTRWLKVFSLLLLASMVFSFVSPGSVRADDVQTPAVQADPLAKVEQLVLTELEANGQTDFFIWMTEKADLSPAYSLTTKEEKGQFVYETLVATAERTQANLREFLTSQAANFQPFYIANKILVRGGNMDLLSAVAARPDVAEITANHKFQLEEPMIDPTANNSPEGIEPNISFIKADQVWALGVTGVGTVVAGNDTGLDETHPAIARHYRGCLNPPDCTSWDYNYNWWDATGTYPNNPNDGHGHGTHTTGTMVGDDGGANQIGVAPGAQTVHCKNMTNGGSGDDGTFTTCFQWDLAPWDLNMANPRPDLAPDAINNSWGYWGGGANQFRDEIQALHAAGILVEVSAGNEGSACSTLRSPGDYFEVLTTGSVNHVSAFPGSLTGFSSRGPSSLDPGYFFPDIMAPGENIRSSVPGGGYQGGWSGTSMSGPHATALVGLMWSACPSLQGNVSQTLDIIQQYASPLTGVTGSNCGGDYVNGPNNDWGFGTIDALEIVQATIAQCTGVGTLEGTATDAGTSAPLEGVNVLAEWAGGFSWSDVTGADGTYGLTLPQGDYVVTASKFAYIPQTVNLTIITDTVTVQNFAMVAAPSYLVYGTVTDDQTGWPLYARISVDGTPYNNIWTDPVTGYYEFSLPAGTTYTVHATPWVGGYIGGVETFTLVGNTQVDFFLSADMVACSAPGYTLQAEYYQNFESGDGGYTTGGSTSWAWGTPTSGPGNAHSGSKVWATNPAGAYNNNENGYVQSPNIDLTALAGQSIGLSWWQWLQTEANYDYATVQVSKDGGATWTNVYGPEDGPIDMQWTNHSVNLDATYAVSNFRVRFLFTSDSSVTYPGWYVDDIVIVGAPPPATVFTQDFDVNNGGFTVSGGFTSWAWGIPTSGPGAAHSLPNVWATNLGGNYNNGEDGYITSPYIDLSAYAGNGVFFNWFQWLNSEQGWDFASVQVSNNGGTTWATVYGPISGAVDLSWAQHLAALDASYAVANFQARFHFTSDGSVVNPGWYVDDVSVAVGQSIAPECVAPISGGLVVGNTYDANNNAPLVGALVANDAGGVVTTAETPDDPAVDDGFYTIFSDDGSHDFTATMDGGYLPETNTVVVVNHDTVGHDFFLDAGYLVASPLSLAVTLELGASTVEPLTLNNMGTGVLNYEIAERDQGFDPIARVSVPRFEGTLPPDSAPQTNALSPSAPAGVTGGSPLGWGINGFPAFAYDAYPGNNLVSFDTDTPGTFNVIGPGPAGDFVPGADFLGGDFSTLYAVNYYGSTLFAVDTATGVMTPIGPATPGGGETWSGLTGAPDGTLYGAATTCGSSTLYTVDPATAAVTPVGPITNGACIIDIAMNANGDLYGIDIIADNFLSIDPATGAGTIIGSIGINANYAQGMDFEEESDTLFWASYSSSGELRIIDVSTGASTPVGPFQGGAEVDGLAFATGGGGADVPWLSEAPISGTIAGGASQPVDVTFDASAIGQPGDYFADLRISTDTPYPGVVIPVTMTVNVPSTYGKLLGTVVGLGYCDADPGALKEATVVISNAGGVVATILTDAAGYYQYWLEQGTYTVDVSFDGHLGESSIVTVVAGANTTEDFGLRWIKPCLGSDPADLHMTLDWGTTGSLPLTLQNTGAGGTPFAIAERDQGFIPILSTVTLPAQPLTVPDGTAAAGGAYTPQPARPVQIAGVTPEDGPNILVVHADDGADDIIALLNAYGDLGLIDAYDARGGTPTLPELEAYNVVVTWANYVYADPTGLGNVLADYVDGGGRVIDMQFATDPNWGLAGRFITENYTGFKGSGTIYTTSCLGSFLSHPIMDGVTDMCDLFRLGGTYLTPDATEIAQYQDGEVAVAAKDNRTVVSINAYPGPYSQWTGQLDLVLHNAILWLAVSPDVPWLFEAPITGTLPADTGTALITVDFDATVIFQPGDYLADLAVSSDDPVNDPFNVPVVMTVNPLSTWGKVTGSVTDSCLNVPLEEVLISFPSGFPITSTLTDASGHYTAWLEQGAIPFTFSMPGYLDQSFIVNVTAGATTTLNVVLVPDRPCIEVNRDLIEVWVLTDTMVYTDLWGLDMANMGGQDLSFEFVEFDQGYTPTLGVSIPRFTGTVAPDTGPQTNNRSLNAPVASPAGFSPFSGINGFPAFAFDVYPGGNLVSFDTDTPGVFNVIGTIFDPFVDFFPGGDFLNGDFSMEYAVSYYGNDFLVIDTSNANLTPIGFATPGGGETWSGLSGASDGTLYGAATTCGTSTLYTINPATGATTTVGPITNGGCIIDIAINAAGEMFGVDIITDNLIAIDPATGAGTVVGSTGVNANYAQGMDFEEDSNTLFWAAYTSSGELRIIDPSTGASAPVGGFANGAEVDGLAFATGGAAGDVPWLWEEVVSGTLPAGTADNFDIFFSSVYTDGTPMPLGTYFATLRVRNNDPVKGTQTIDVIMHVVAEYLAPDLSFTATTPVMIHTPTDFTNTSGFLGIPPATEFEWDFGDGTGMTVGLLDPVSHTYAAAGTYTVTLHACNIFNYCDTFTADVVVLNYTLALPVINKH